MNDLIDALAREPKRFRQIIRRFTICKSRQDARVPGEQGISARLPPRKMTKDEGEKVKNRTFDV